VLNRARLRAGLFKIRNYECPPFAFGEGMHFDILRHPAFADLTAVGRMDVYEQLGSQSWLSAELIGKAPI
jgi:hypothetical protein